jgi:sulfoxide reductase catalytic subunit YedY
MQTRREVLKRLLLALIPAPIFWRGRGQAARASGGAEASGEIVFPGTPPERLIGKHPRTLDTSRFEVMPLESFGTMGLTDHEVDPDTWRLQVSAGKAAPVSLTYRDLLPLARMEREVLLICPGVFVNHGRWKGISFSRLLRIAGGPPGLTHVTVRGPAGRYAKTHRLALAEIAGDEAFLATAVNGRPLPVKHGYPLRLVSRNDYGFDWVKYVDSVAFERIP